MAAVVAAVATAFQGVLLGPVLRLVLSPSDSGRLPRFPAFNPLQALTSGSWQRHHGALLFTLAGISVLRAVFTAVDNACWPLLSERIALSLRVQTLQDLLDMPAEGLDALPPGVATSRVIVEPRDAASGAATTAAALFRDGLSVAVLAVIALFLRPDLFLVTAVVWPLIGWGLHGSARRVRSSTLGSLQHRDDLAAWAALLPTAGATISVSGARAWVAQRVRQSATHHALAEGRRALVSAIASPATELIGALGVTLALALLGRLPPTTADRTLGFFYIVFMAYRPLKNLGTLQVSVSSATLALTRLDELHAATSKPPPAVTAHSLTAPSITVWRGQRSLALPNPVSVLPGSLTALTGASGAGKTTLLEALARLRPSIPGVSLDGVHLRDAVLHAGFASQHPPLLPVSLRDNLTLGRSSVDGFDAVLASLGLAAWVAGLPLGADTLLGPGGVDPSAGERQRIGLARALLTDAPLVLLDEPTAGLDEATAVLVRSTLRNAANLGRGILVVTHDASLAALADRVIAL